MKNTSEFGQWSENYVAQYLENKDYRVVDRNYRKKWGEIDIIAQKEGILIFVEVKANKEDLAGFEPERRVSPEKLRRMNRAIQTYLAYKKYGPDQEWQIDIISLTLDRDRGVAKIKHFKNIDL
ncbi:MAG: YraN family protein [Candidatus Taylorbacteria bacterium]|nr:YraN family protein [Candidatus Taylorbacteria bacterium]